LLKTIDASPGDAALHRQLEKFTDLAEKDLDITLEYAAELGVTLPVAAACRQVMARVYGVRNGEDRAQAPRRKADGDRAE